MTTSGHIHRRPFVADTPTPLGARSPLERTERGRARPGSPPTERTIGREGAADRPFVDARRTPLRTSPTAILAGHALLGLVWLAATVLVVEPVAARSGSSLVVVGAASATTFLVVSTVVLGLHMHRWRSQTVARLRGRTSPAEVQRLRAMFLGAVSHELRTPMTTIIGYAQTLREHHHSLTDEEIRDFCDRLVRNGERLEQLVLDLLDLRGDGRATLVPATVDLDELLRRSVDECRDSDLLLSVRSEVGTVTVDRHAVTRIVSELLDNARRHTPAGTRVSVTAAIHRELLLLVVEDDGPGIDPSIAGRVSDPFVQGDHIAGVATPGLGIGLSLAAHHANRHGGELRLAGSTGGGTRATVVLPALDAA